MCGIVGYLGFGNAQNIILEGLEKLEYRGYDSSGITVEDEQNQLHTAKRKGRLSVLEAYTDAQPLQGNLGIGHTRWATHGEPSDENAHPHLNEKNTISVVHNGIIENYMTLKDEMEELGYHFSSDTDTEVLAHMIDHYFDGDLRAAVNAATSRVRGSYALAVISSEDPGKLVAVRKESPLIVGAGENEFFVASDIPAILKHTDQVYFLENGEVTEITHTGLRFFDVDRQEISKEVYTVEWDVESASKGGYDHFMLKEIHEQPQAIRESLNRRLDEHGKIRLDDITLSKEDLDAVERIYIVACGTAYNAGNVGKVAIEKLSKIPVFTEIASEFRYNDPYVDEHTLLILVSQSGETADTLAALRLGKEKGARILCITNVVGSSIARESDDVFYTWAGPEIAVASTKAYTTQLIALYMLALYMGETKETLAPASYYEMIAAMQELPAKAEELLEHTEIYTQVSNRIKNAKSLFYLGRGLDYQSCLEAALKIKEVSYIHTEAFAAGELKHGTIALIEDGTPVISLLTQEALYEKMCSNIKEVKARGAYSISITTKNHRDQEKISDQVLYIPQTSDLLAPVLSVIPCQLIAYYTSFLKGIDVDKPRNLAKSVTVE